MNKSVNKNILFENFAGRATPLQKKLIEAWIQEPSNKELYYEWLDEWENQFIQILPDVDAALEKSLLKIEQSEQIFSVANKQTSPNYFNKNRTWLAVAAAITVFISIGLFLVKNYILYQNYQTAFGEIEKIELADGSQITLNANSSLKVPRFGFGNTIREVLLTGEANFSVKHTIDNKRFIVKTHKNFEIEVLGTEFNVNARQKDTKVVLNKGKIQLSYKDGKVAKKITMKPGDLVIIDQKGHLNLKEVPQPQIFSAWKEQRFVFDETSLQEVATMIEENFGLTIGFREDFLAKRTISGTFHAENADELLQVIAELLEINYNRQNNNVTFFE
ncbi:MAG: FecR family protein [Emticicia sp.]